MQCINQQRLLAAFHSVPDPRRPQGRRYSLAAILTVAVAAILAKTDVFLAIAEWAADQSSEVLARLRISRSSSASSGGSIRCGWLRRSLRP